MRLLLIDTCGAQGSVALAEDAAVVATELLPGRSASERLVAVIRSLLENQGWRLAELAAIGIVHGPGSFTGVRVGLSAAKGLSEASGVPLLAISRLALLTRGRESALAALDAGRGEFYLGRYGADRCRQEGLATQEELRVAVGDEELIVCEAKLAEALVGMRLCVVPEPMATDALGIVLRRIEAGQFEDVATLDANYLRRTDEQLFARKF